MSAAEEILSRLAEKKGISARQIARLSEERPELFARAKSEEPEEERESERIEREEGELLGALLKARQEAGPTQAEGVARMGTQSTPMGDRTISAE